MNADPLDEALRDAAPLGPGALDRVEVRDAVSALWARTRAGEEIAGSDDGPTADLIPFVPAGSPRRTRRTITRTVIATSVVLVAGTGVAAASGFLDLRTGVFGEPGMTENDTSELLNSASPEIAPLMRSYLEEMPLAPGYSADPLIERFVGQENTLVQEAGLRAVVFSWSSCSWQLTWLDAYSAGDAAALASATEVLDQIPDWPVVPLVDGDGGLTASVNRIADAATAGDPAPIERDTAINCDLDIAR
jgi:hypothetical protein